MDLTAAAAKTLDLDQTEHIFIVCEKQTKTKKVCELVIINLAVFLNFVKID